MVPGLRGQGPLVSASVWSPCSPQQSRGERSGTDPETGRPEQPLPLERDSAVVWFGDKKKIDFFLDSVQNCVQLIDQIMRVTSTPTHNIHKHM